MLRGLRISRARITVIMSIVSLSMSALLPASVSAAPSATPDPAATSATAGPISIADGCSYKTMNSGLNLFGGGTPVFGHGYNFFMVTFTNNAPVTANRIVFQIDFGKASRIAIPDVGTFAPGTAVSQTFRDNGKGMVFSARPTPNDGSVICTVLSATFTDGTTYTAPPAPTASPSP
jgi:hypothetical protein